MYQSISSKNTSISTVNSIYKKIPFPEGSMILDYGGGKYDKNKEYMKEKGSSLFVYDKYNRTLEENAETLSVFKDEGPQYIVCSNVLNVILEDEVIHDILLHIKSLSSPYTRVYFAIYEGNRSGIGVRTSKGWQRNLKTKEYVATISDYFEITEIKGNIISCNLRKDNPYVCNYI